MIQLKHYPIYKKRDGQSFQEIGSIYENSFVKAKKEFAKRCANDLYNDCNLTYLSSDEFDTKGFESGFYYNNSLVYNEDGIVNVKESYIDCLLSQKAIYKGFTYFSEDVYTWELRKK